MISYVIPHRDRPESLALVLDRLASLGDHAPVGGAEVIVVDNASARIPRVPDRLPSGVRVRLLERPTNAGAAARNSGARAADPASDWLVMLDDDSHPIDDAFLERLRLAPGDAGALSADIHLPLQSRREDGGLPEVFVGCGVAIRRDLFLALGGYDASFGYYAEEYDLAARILLAGRRIVFEPCFRVAHLKARQGRDFNVILSRLVRNNAWIAERYAPDSRLPGERREVLRRYLAIAHRENAIDGFRRGLAELRATRRLQPRSPMNPAIFERFVGLEHARNALAAQLQGSGIRTAALVDEGKNAWVVASVLVEAGIRIVPDARGADALVIATMSPGPMIDAMFRRRGSHPRVLVPWLPALAMRDVSLARHAPLAA